jgi:hypothetical protein
LCNREELRQAAEQWRDANTVAEQEAIFQKHGVCWSPLWRLPYWNPVQMLVVNPMHALLEGLAKFHYLNVLCFTDTAAKVKPAPPPAFTWDFLLPNVSDEPVIVDINGEPSAKDETPALPIDQPWTKQQYNQVQSIHRVLVAELCDVSG